MKVLYLFNPNFKKIKIEMNMNKQVFLNKILSTYKQMLISVLTPPHTHTPQTHDSEVVDFLDIVKSLIIKCIYCFGNIVNNIWQYNVRLICSYLKGEQDLLTYIYTFTGCIEVNKETLSSVTECRDSTKMTK